MALLVGWTLAAIKAKALLECIYESTIFQGKGWHDTGTLFVLPVRWLPDRAKASHQDRTESIQILYKIQNYDL